jgi:hypothetical protein
MQQQRLTSGRFPKTSTAMKQVDEIIYDAIRADEELMTAISGHVVSTCFEVSPTDADNTPLPYIIVTDDGFQNQVESKDDSWEGTEDRVSVGVEVAAESPQDVKRLIRMVRQAVASYIGQMYDDGEDIPELDSLSSDGLAWDWTKPCYYQRLTYQCITNTEV